MNEKLNFPLFRKYPDNRSFFKVFSPDEFEEIKLMGNNYAVHRIKATILPDRNYIDDMIRLHNGHWVEIEEEEFVRVKKDCEQNKRLLP